MTLVPSLDRLRRRLTAWHVGTLLAILATLGVGLFATMTARFDRELDQSLSQASREIVRVARTRASSGPRSLLDSTTDLRIPDRQLLVLDTLGRAEGEGAEQPDEWIQTLARDAWHGRTAFASHRDGDVILRGYGESFSTTTGRHLVAIAVANEIELEDRYASLIVAFSVAALAAVLLVAAGGWLLARKSMAPIEAAFAQRRRFMADAAHELRTPLTIVRGRAEVALQRPRTPQEYEEVLRAIEQDSTRVGRIVEDLLMLARADAGERPIERARRFLDDIALDAANSARVIAERRGADLQIAEVEETPVEGDEMLLRQLVLILLDNAIKFGGQGAVVRVSVVRCDASAVLKVSDTGPGIAIDQLPHVFDRFYRGDAARAREPGADDAGLSEGAGLGLSIARWIADEHGATISINSQVGRGTTVAVEFPLAIVRTPPHVSSS